MKQACFSLLPNSSMSITRIKEIVVSSPKAIEDHLHLHFGCNTKRILDSKCAKELNTPALVIKYFERAEYFPPKITVYGSARHQKLEPIFENPKSAKKFSGICSCGSTSMKKELNWYPTNIKTEAGDNELDLLVETSVEELHSVLSGKTPAGVLASD